MTIMEIFNPNRLKFARKRRGLTIRALSEKLEITSKSFSDYENGRREPPDSKVTAIANELNFPIRFFFLDDIKDFDDSEVSFRSLSRMPAYVRDAALHAGRIAIELNEWLDEKFEMPSADLPDLRDYEPEQAAEILRNEWGLGQLPIRNMVHLLEAKGVRVFSLVEDTYDMDAYSFWMGSHPYMFLNTKKSVERSRFDSAHELGHLVLHKHCGAKGKESESQANRFASALLMPSSSILSRAPRLTTLDWIISFKSFWIVSASALVRRMKDLGLITEWQYRSLAIELSKRGFLKREPNPTAQRETSKLLPMVFQALREDGITKNDIARELGLFVDEINTLIFHLTFTEVCGGAPKASSGSKSGKNHLRIIK